MKILRFLWRHLWKILLAVIIVGPIVWLVIFLTKEEPPEYITATAKRGDLVQIVDAVGTITSEKDLELKFPVSGIVSAVHVNEGDAVTAGQKLAELRNKIISADIASAEANVRRAQAEYRALREGTRPEDIAITEAEVENKRAALRTARSTLESAEAKLERSQKKLRALRLEVETSLSGYVSTSRSTISEEIDTALTALNVITDVLEDYDVQDAFIKHKSGETELIRAQQRDVSAAIGSLLAKKSSLSDYTDAIILLQEAKNVVSQTADVVYGVYRTIIALPTTTYLTASEREVHKDTLSDERASLQSSLSALDAAIKDLRDEVAHYDTQIAAEEHNVATAQGDRDNALADIQTFQTAILVQEAQLALKKAGTRKADIDAAYARVQQAKAELQRTQAEFEDTILTAPIDGTITKVNLKPGEFTPGQFTATEPAITLLGASPYRVDMYVAEIDIPKVKLSHSGAIELDAFPDILYKLRVGEVDPAATDVGGVSKYLVKLDFVSPREEFKIGMTGDAEIYTDFREDIIMVPARAVVEDEDGDVAVRILKDNEIEWRKVETGMEGVNDIEIISGVEEGETVIVLIK